MTPLVDVQIVDHPVRAHEIDPFPPECGAEACFLGRTRMERHEEHGELKKLSYEAHRSMAERVLQQLAERAAADFHCTAVRVHHAVGDVAPGEASVLVQVATGHRAEAFTACRWLIDTLKTEVPIWKREHWADGTTWSEGSPVEVGT